MPRLHLRFFGNFWICQQCWKSAFCFDLSREFLQGATIPPLQPRIFCNYCICQQCWKTAFCLDLCRVFLRVPACHSYTIEYFSDLSLVWERDRYSLGELHFCFDMSKVLLQGTAIPALHLRKVETFLEQPVGKRQLQQARVGTQPAGTLKLGVQKKPLKKGPQNLRKGHQAHFELQASSQVSNVSQ